MTRFEGSFSDVIGTRHAIGVGTGTDALRLSLLALGIGPGDEVITTANTFVATVGAIETTGARTRFVDCDEQYVMEVGQVEAAITPRTRAILPVHYAGQPVDMPALMAIAAAHDLVVVEDACQAIDAMTDGKRCGTWGAAGGFSLHPLKNLNVWGDGGVITTDSDELDTKLRLMRNHGMIDRDTYAFYAYNSRLDSLQAVVGNHLIADTLSITDRRIAVAERFDAAFADLPDRIRIPARSSGVRCVYHLYILLVEDRDGLNAYLQGHGIESKIHYPTPLHLQPASEHLGYRRGDFPVAEAQASSMITLPVHQHLTEAEIDYVIARVRAFYRAD